MLDKIKVMASEFKEKSEGKLVRVISDYDTDGITSAAIMTKALKREDKKFSVTIAKHLEQDFIDNLKKELSGKEVLIFLDFGSTALEALNDLGVDIFILDHHEVPKSANLESYKNIRFVNPRMFNHEVSAAGLAYLFAKAINEENKDSASLAVIGMVGDMLDQSISKVNDSILKDASDVVIKKGPLIFSATRPLNKALEFSSSFFIPGVTGNAAGAMHLLREIGLKYENGRFPSLADLTKEELSQLITAIMLRRVNQTDKYDDIIGNIYLIKFFGQMQDARELSTMVNACSRLGHSELALAFCMENSTARTKALEVYDSYKHEIISSLNMLTRIKKIEGRNYVVINARDKIRDTIIGTVLSITASSFMYPEGTILVGMAHQESKIKVSMRVSGRNSEVNLSKIIEEVVKITGGESGGHERAAGCFIPKELEEKFIEVLTNQLDTREIRIQV